MDNLGCKPLKMELFHPTKSLVTLKWAHFADSHGPRRQVLFPKPEKAGDATLLQPRGVRETQWSFEFSASTIGTDEFTFWYLDWVCVLR